MQRINPLRCLVAATVIHKLEKWMKQSNSSVELAPLLFQFLATTAPQMDFKSTIRYFAELIRLQVISQVWLVRTCIARGVMNQEHWKSLIRELPISDLEQNADSINQRNIILYGPQFRKNESYQQEEAWIQQVRQACALLFQISANAETVKESISKLSHCTVFASNRVLAMVAQDVKKMTIFSEEVVSRLTWLFAHFHESARIMDLIDQLLTLPQFASLSMGFVVTLLYKQFDRIIAMHKAQHFCKILLKKCVPMNKSIVEDVLRAFHKRVPDLIVADALKREIPAAAASVDAITSTTWAISSELNTSTLNAVQEQANPKLGSQLKYYSNGVAPEQYTIALTPLKDKNLYQSRKDILHLVKWCLTHSTTKCISILREVMAFGCFGIADLCDVVAHLMYSHLSQGDVNGSVAICQALLTNGIIPSDVFYEHVLKTVLNFKVKYCNISNPSFSKAHPAMPQLEHYYTCS